MPQALKEQLSIDAVLVMPIGPMHGQRLIKVRKSTAKAYEEAFLGAVSFVPLITGR